MLGSRGGVTFVTNSQFVPASCSRRYRNLSAHIVPKRPWLRLCQIEKRCFNSFMKIGTVVDRHELGDERRRACRKQS